MPSYLFLEVVREASTATVWLSRPPVNAVTQAMYREIRECFATIGELSATRCVLLRGRGKHFCAGNDLGEFASLDEHNASTRMREVREAFAAVYECPLPTIAVVTGAALGTGIALAASCDFVIAENDALIGTPEVGVGVMGGGRHLARLVGESRMRAMYFTAKPARAEDLAVHGSIIAAPLELLDDVVDEHVRLISSHDPVLLRHAKASLNRSEHLPLKAAYEVEQEFTVAVASTHASREARRQLMGEASSAARAAPAR